MKWFVGLGNPGAQYAGTRHNVGFMVIDELARRWGITVNQSKCKALIGEGNVQGTKVFLIKPMTYMNLSGESARAFMDYYKADLADGLFIYDDMDTEVGKIRLRYQGSSGGHNGIKSLIQHFGTQSFNRIRMGVSRPQPGYPIVDYVLANFAKSEQPQLQSMIEQAADAAEFSLKATFEQTMAKFNG
ncbi:aminoacyl-tRNA hydrolase [Paenibacillus protaetiae]|uniref:Peptidyl-tRNA hydrolase n=1 Tax=Paenibacillus protaetiae TaxID=2509456 RepID=A0A4P6F061_9BACL|nr:aminoacyl-tRNA hydrolase [Paenibacillus protaetiae]QAY67459.1 aminoacyl-tRNA hydrolase [Paenibacillus protaetiae]